MPQHEQMGGWPPELLKNVFGKGDFTPEVLEIDMKAEMLFHRLMKPGLGFGEANDWRNFEMEVIAKLRDLKAERIQSKYKFEKLLKAFKKAFKYTPTL